MPSIRKRIGYLPSINAHETITKIAIKEKLSQSKVVGILVEEALIARDELDVLKSNDFNKKSLSSEKRNMDKSSFEYKILNNISDVINSATSSYYPVEWSSVLSILENTFPVLLFIFSKFIFSFFLI